MSDWLNQLWDNLTAVSLPVLVLGLALQTAQTCFVALAWRNILRSAYPEHPLPYRETLAYYAGGNGLNALLPAAAGTVAMLGLFRSAIPGSTVAGLVGATFVENIFFAIVSGMLYLALFLSVTGSFEVELGWFADHAAITAVIVIGGTALIAVVVRILWHRLKQTWENAKDGAAILRQPRRFAVQVVGVEAISYVARMGVNATFMYAFDVPVSLQNVLLIIAASSISSTVAVAPGAVGAQTALASVVLKGVAPQATISAYTIGQQVICTAWNVVFGLTLLARAIGWKETRELMHKRKKGDDAPLPDEPAAGEPAVAAEVPPPPS